VATFLMLLDVLGGPTFDPRPAAVAGGIFLIAGIVLALLSQPSRRRTARMLDRSFGLQERLTTALDDLGLGVPTIDQRAPVVYLQMADAANAVAAVRHDRRLRPAIPVREVVLIVLAALILTTLAFLRGLGGGLPELAAARVPPFTPAIERPVEPEPSAAELDAATLPPTVQEVLERSDRSSRARRDLQELAAALEDHAATRPAAEEIAGGDYAAAGEQLREAAAQAGDMSQGAREGLAGDLDRASQAMEPETSGLQEASRDAAAGLRQGEAPARTEMRDLADAVEIAGEEVVPQGELAAQMRSAQQSQQQGGQNESRSASSSLEGEIGDPSSQFSPSDDPGSGADASSSFSSDPSEQQASQGDESGQQSGNSDQGQSAGDQGGQANAPGDADNPGDGSGGSRGDAAQSGNTAIGPEGDGDSATARQGSGAGTGESGEDSGERASSSATDMQAGAGEAAANPEISSGDGAEGDPSELGGANDRVALPAGSGQDGVQTSSDGGAALRGSGAGVTAGSGFATQGEVGEAGPDSNRVPPRHRETVERYFSGGNE
jgi:hypothetical protein